MKSIILTTLTLGLLAGTAQAHATLEVQSAPAGSTYKGVMRIGHGCDGQATEKVSIQIPDGVIAVKPMPKAGWTLQTNIGAYDRTYEHYGTELTEGVRQITWTGSLEDAHYDEFVFRGNLSADLAAGEHIWFKTVQTCADGTQEWVNIPTGGQDAHDIEGAAPGLMIEAAGHAHH